MAPLLTAKKELKCWLPWLALILVWLFSFFLLIFKTVPVSGDGIYYYVQLESLVEDGDINFENNLEKFTDNTHVKKQLDSDVLTPKGLTPNLFSVGPGILWSPFYLLAKVFGGDKYLACSIAISIYGLFGLLLAYSFLRRAVNKHPWLSVFSILAVYIGTNLFYYLTFETSMSHGLGFFVVTLLFWLWQRANINLKNNWYKFGSWVLVGLAVGLCGLVRWQLLGLIILPIIDLIKKQNFYGLGPFGLGLIVGFSPQIFVWKALYGSWLLVPQGVGFIDLTSPHFLDVLFSSRHGLFTWSPLILLSLIGLVVFIVSRKTNKGLKYISVLILLIWILQVYINGTLIEWWGGDAFGPRRFADLSFLYMFGLVVLFFRLNRNWARWLIGSAIGIIIVGNILLMQVYRHNLILRDQPLTVSQTVEAVQKLLR